MCPFLPQPANDNSFMHIYGYQLLEVVLYAQLLVLVVLSTQEQHVFSISDVNIKLLISFHGWPSIL